MCSSDLESSIDNELEGFIQGSVVSNITINYEEEILEYFEYIELEDGYSISGLTNAGLKINKLELPTTYNNKDIIAIADNAFKGNQNIISVTMPNKITSIGASAFSECENLQIINISEDVITIGNNAFKNCYSLEHINYNAINCNDLSYNNYIFDKAGEYNGLEVVIGDMVQHIPSYLFGSFNNSNNNSNIKTLVIGSNVTEIGQYAFYKSNKITSITIPEKVTTIGNNAFGYCSNLENIIFNATNCNDLTSNIYVFGSSGLNGNGIKVKFGEGVEKIPAYWFYSNNTSSAPKIANIEMSSTIKNIGISAFQTSAENVKMNYLGTLEQWCEIEFGNAQSNPIYFAKALTVNGVTLNTLIIPNSVTSVNKYAFYGFSTLLELTIPETVTSIGSYAFYGCSSLNKFNYFANISEDFTYNSDVFTNMGIASSGLEDRKSVV